MSDASDTTLETRRRLQAPPERVFVAFTDPALLARWMTPVGIARAEVEVRVGGTFRIVMSGAGREIEHTGEYLEVDPPRRLRFTWQSPYTGPEPSVVEVTLRAIEGGTELTLIHRLLPPGAAASHAGGWGTMLDRLAALVEGRP